MGLKARLLRKTGNDGRMRRPGNQPGSLEASRRLAEQRADVLGRPADLRVTDDVKARVVLPDDPARRQQQLSGRALELGP